MIVLFFVRCLVRTEQSAMRMLPAVYSAKAGATVRAVIVVAGTGSVG